MPHLAEREPRKTTYGGHETGNLEPRARPTLANPMQRAFRAERLTGRRLVEITCGPKRAAFVPGKSGHELRGVALRNSSRHAASLEGQRFPEKGP